MKQQQLTFEKGMTNVPSDAICSDNALEDSTNMIYRDGEHHVIQRPKQIFDFGENSTKKLLYVHKHPDASETYISYSGQYLYAGTSVNPIYSSISGTPSVQAIGNILVLKDANGLHYILWKSGSYTNIGDMLSEPSVEFRMGVGNENAGGPWGGSRTPYSASNTAPEVDGMFDTSSNNLSGKKIRVKKCEIEIGKFRHKG